MRTDAKKRILKAGARIIQHKGYNDAGLQEILDSAGVPKGSFYFHFKTKENFGLQLIDYLSEFFLERADELLEAEGENCIERIKTWLDWQADSLKTNDFKGGCPFGNLSQEMAGRNDLFRDRLDDVFGRLREKLSAILLKAQERREIVCEYEASDAADFILNAWQGTLLQMKVAKSMAPRESFDRMVFGHLLKRP